MIKSPGARYGLLMAFVFFVAQFAWPPYGLSVLWAVLGVHLAWGSIVCWRRTGLTLAATAMLLGAANLGILAALESTGRPFLDWPWPWLVFMAASFVVGGSCMFAEQYVHPRQWTEWDRFMEQKTGWDILLGRHIPDLRVADRSRVS